MNNHKFQKNCQLWHNKMKTLVKKGKFSQAFKLRQKISIAISEWKKQERLAKERVRQLSALFTIAEKEAREIELNIKMAEKRKTSGGNDEQK